MFSLGIRVIWSEFNVAATVAVWLLISSELLVTLTVSSRLPISSAKFTVRFWFACSSTPLRCDVRNPVNSALMS